MAYNPVDALGAVELGKDEFLLVFNTLGVYVDVHGMKSRDKVSYFIFFNNKVKCIQQLLYVPTS